MMLQNRFHIFLGFICICVVHACKKSTDSLLPNLDYSNSMAYFPLVEGSFLDYSVTHIVHDDEVDIHDTTHFTMRIQIGDTFADNSGSFPNKYFRYRWDLKTAQWQLTDVWSALIKNNSAFITTENQRTNIMMFPISKNIYWNSNRFNDLDSTNCYYRNIHQPSVIGSYSFDSTLTVCEQDYFTFVDLKRKYEVYAKGVGLVSKYYKDLIITDFDSLKVKLGEEWFYTLINKGKK